MVGRGTVVWGDAMLLRKIWSERIQIIMSQAWRTSSVESRTCSVVVEFTPDLQPPPVLLCVVKFAGATKLETSQW